MEYVHGESLRSMLDREQVLPAGQAIALAVQALDGLAHAHALRYVDELGSTGAGIIHRDIKPANLLVDEHGNLKLTDFGIVKVLGEGQVTKTGFNPGTIDYMSPEQISGLPVDTRSDVYSLGVTLYEMLTGRVPFPRRVTDSDYDILKAHMETDPSPMRTLNPEIPSSLAEIVTRSLKREPGQRWQTAADFREALLAHQQNRPLPASVARPAQAKPRFAPSRAARLGWLYAVLALVATAVPGVLWLARSGKIFQPAPDQPSIAVLPFADVSSETGQEYFSDGLTDELQTALEKVPGLRVQGRTSSFQFKGKTADFSVIGKKLHVTAILEGTVRKQGKHVRITAQLIKAADGFHLWSETYDQEMDDIFAVQDRIARSVTAALSITLLGKKTTARPAQHTNADAYNAYLLGKYFRGQQSQESKQKAVGYFEQAIKLDPGYAPAWLGLGECRTTQAGAADIAVEEGYRTARAAITQALKLDPNLVEAHAALGEIEMLHDWEWAGADASFQRALALDPRNAEALRDAGSLARMLGRLEEAITLYRRAIEIDPLTGHRGLGMNLYYAGRQSEAKAAFEKTLEFAPQAEFAHEFLGQVELAQLHPREALAEAEKERHPGYRLVGLALVYHALGRNKESAAKLAELIGKFQADYWYQIAEVYAFRGETDRAFEWLERAYRERDIGITEMKSDPLLSSLRADPRYTALLKKMRLPL